MPISPNPFTAEASSDAEDATLAQSAAQGDYDALEQLVQRHQDWIYNLALRMKLNPYDAADLAQEALLRIVTRIAQFEGRSGFRTWAYRIVTNCFLDSKRGRLEQAIVSFDQYGIELDELPLQDLSLSPELEPERHLILEEAKVGCMLGMLLCLSREQRLAYVLGEIFEAPSEVAGEILGVSAATFRKRLERARMDLTQFMNNKCGLMNEANPCRCARKTAVFIQQGWVDPHRLKFVGTHLQKIKQEVPQACKQVESITSEAYGTLFRNHPFHQGPDVAQELSRLLEDPQTQATFQLN